ncbi:MAG TPA: two-component regulator propeller domain-containing protein [Longimicrobium sp.]|jgi:diguanylate cyclase (GGDEF)-like protein|uniref:two-component regulator propeller domain-containing protein n=1 Tax=Longimicrobium sp. TaxID=2029185 RepID=UPI002ED7EFC1
MRPPAGSWSRGFAAVLLAVSHAAAQPARSPAEDPPRFTITGWSTEHGLPSNVARDIRQTPDGYLWLASFEGLVRFDGVAFRSFAEAEIPGLARASFRRLAVDRRGALWAASETGGVVRWAGGEWRVFTTRDGLTSDRVTALLPDPDGSLWVGTRAGVSRIAGEQVTRLALPAGEPEPAATALALDGEGGLWIGTVASGVLRHRGGALTRIMRRDGLGDDRVTALRTDRDGAVWVGTFAGVARIHQGRVTRPGAASAARPSPVNDLLQDPDGAWWLAADNGLFRLQGDRITPVPRPDGEAFTQVEGLDADREGNVWIGSRQGGLFRLRRPVVRMLTSREGLPHDFAAAITGDAAGGAWIATRGGVVHRSAGGPVAYTRASGALRDDVARDVLRDRAGDVWVASNSGLTRLRGGGATTYTVREGLPDDRVRVVLEDRAGALWVGTYNGLARLADGKWTHFGPRQGLPDGYVLSLHQDRAGTLWVGTQSAGLFRLDGARFVPGPAALAGQPVFRMMDDADGTLWVGTSRGLARLRAGHVALFTTRNGLHGNTVFQALDDGAGALWLTGPWGIARVPRRDLEAVGAGRTRMVNANVFGISDGLAAREVSSIGGAWRAPDGVLHFPTPAGVALIDPRRLLRTAVPLQALIERVVTSDGESSGARDVVAAPGRHRLEIHFTAPSFVSPDELRFRYRLAGFDGGWVDGGTRRDAFYTNVPPGRYRFHVQVRNEDGVWSGNTASVALRLQPYFWQTRWFYALAILLLAAAIFGLHRLRVRAAEFASREEVLRAMSLRDELTGLYNRRGLLALAEQQIQTSVRQRVGFHVLFVDLDHLKQINDSLGHAQGDQALRDAAGLLRSTFRKSDVVARLGGDEFAVLVIGRTPGDASPRGAEVAISRLYDAIEHHVATVRRPYTLSMSVGASRFDPEAPATLEALLQQADQQMYADKRIRSGPRATPGLPG